MKGIGVLAVLLTGLGAGMMTRQTMVKRIRFLSQFERFLQSVSECIRCTGAPIMELLNSLAESGELRDFPLLHYMVGHQTTQGDFRVVWEKGVREMQGELTLSEEETRLFLGFSEGFGTLDVMGEIHHCQQYMRLVRECLERRQEEQRTKGGLHVALGLCGGCAVILLLL